MRRCFLSNRAVAGGWLALGCGSIEGGAHRARLRPKAGERPLPTTGFFPLFSKKWVMRPKCSLSKFRGPCSKKRRGRIVKKEGKVGSGGSGDNGRGSFHHDALHVAVLIFLLGVMWEFLNSQRDNVIRKLREWAFLTLEVRSSREEYAMIINWMGIQPHGTTTRNISLKPISVVHESPDSTGEGGPGECPGNLSHQNEFVPGFGSHYMTFEGTRLWITRSIDTTKQYRSSALVDREDEVLQLVFFTRDRSVAQRFLKAVRSAWDDQAKSTVRVYIPGGWGSRWEFLSRRLRRPVSTLQFPESTMDIIGDVRLFLESRELYMSLGIPWRRGYLFEGSPGTGKTSFIVALASELSLPIYLLSLQSHQLDDAALIKLVNCIPPKSILVIEDLETAIKSSATGASCDTGRGSNQSNHCVDTEVGGGRAAGVSLSALLNAIDGIASSEGRLLIITSNDASRLPAQQALLRPGRIDHHVHFTPLDSAAMEVMRRSFRRFCEELGVAIEGVTSLETAHSMSTLCKTPAELQNDLLSAFYMSQHHEERSL
uniref:Putative ATP-dependent chaperone n=1 Tax=Trypanosoma congolense (strain IL3000) TaxID=1068625 RepID=G0UXC5_TRYCI|nr:putative ATP-dependent chaperone [Trypanosoma congolense IL3000]